MDSKTKVKYDKVKFIVKKWEKEFRNLTASTPTKVRPFPFYDMITFHDYSYSR